MSSQCLATTWNIAFLTSPKSNFGVFKRQKITFICHSTTWFVALSTWKKSFSVGELAENYFKVTFDNLNHRFFDFIQIAFWVIPEAQNKLRVPCETLKHRFFDINQVAFWDGQEAENESKENATPWNIDFFNFTHVTFWVVLRGRKWVSIAWRPLETTISRSHLRRILGMSRYR